MTERLRTTTASGVVQFTPPGLGVFGPVRHENYVGCARLRQGLYLIVSDVAAARADLAGRGADVSEVFHAGTPGVQFQPDGTSGPDPDGASYSSFATFSDPDGNGCCKR